MKVLWLSNIILPEFADEFGVKKQNMEGWMSGMLTELQKNENITVGFCFPIIDKERLKDGYKNGQSFYSFSCNLNAVPYEGIGEKMTQRFVEIIKDFEPDVIHIWGTEYLHCYAMVKAAEQVEMLSHTMIHIQGLVSVCAKHFLRDIPEKYVTMEVEGHISLQSEKDSFAKRGEYEIAALKMVPHIVGRTLWDKACTNWINPNRNYQYCGEILRQDFYRHAGEWGRDYKPYRIFMTQGTYPIKGIHYMLEALELLSLNYPAVHLYIAGTNIMEKENPSPYARFIANRIQELNLKDKVTYIGQINANDMVEQYKKSHVYVLSSTIENSPNSLCEAMMIGVPVVAALVGGVKDIIRTDMEGLTYQCDAPYMLAYQISRIFDNDIDIMSLSQKETERVIQYNNIAKNVNRLIEIYELVKK